MSRVGKQPIPLPSGVDVKIDGSQVTIKGSKGTLVDTFHPDMSISTDNGSLAVERPSDEKQHKALHGLTRSLLANMVIGVTEGYSRSLELVGVGYRVRQSGKGIKLSVMLSHEVDYQPREGVAIAVEGNNLIHLSGIDKQAVGQAAAEIKKVRPPNVYTGKGIRYRGEQVRLKPGKSARRVE
jgi:large subunit ribosomal protein L6